MSTREGLKVRLLIGEPTHRAPGKGSVWPPFAPCRSIELKQRVWRAR